jgi:hypothetical protein
MLPSRVVQALGSRHEWLVLALAITLFVLSVLVSTHSF